MNQQIQLLEQLLSIFLYQQNVYVLNRTLIQNINLIDADFAQSLQDFSKIILKDIDGESKLLVSIGLQEISRLIRKLENGDISNNIEIAITGYKIALTNIDRNQYSLYWAEGNKFLAFAYQKRIQGNRQDNLENAIYYYEQALLECDYQTEPVLWASILNDLGLAYKSRIQGDKKHDIERAIDCLNQALLVRTRHQFPLYWAKTQYNLGILYYIRIKGNKLNNLENAIYHYKQALLERTKEKAPSDWARTINDLGSAYRERIKGYNLKNQEKAIECFEQALQVYTREDTPKEWAFCLINLASSYIKKRINLKSIGDVNLNEFCQIIDYFHQAWLVSEAEVHSIDIISYLIQIYMIFPKTRRIEKLNLLINEIELHENRITIEKNALYFYRFNFAFSQLYLIKQEEEKASTYIQRAITASQALKNPYFSKDLEYIGNLAYKNQNWEIAIECYEESLINLEKIRSSFDTDSERQQFLQSCYTVYSNMIESCVHSGQLNKALETVERHRCKYLVDLFTSFDISDQHLPSDLEELLAKYEEIQKKINQIYQSQSANFDEERSVLGNHLNENSDRQVRASIQANNYWIEKLEQEKLNTWHEIRRLDTVVAGQTEVNLPNLNNIQNLLNNKCGILSFYVNDHNLYVFVLTQKHIYYHQYYENRTTIQDWFTDNYLLPYIENPQKWIEKLPNLFCNIDNKLQIPQLVEKHLQGLEELIIIPSPYLHLIPFGAIPLNDNETLGDRFLIRYAPSCQILEFCANRLQLTENLAYGTVEDATEDLPCASFEGEQIAQLYQIPEHLRLAGSEQATVTNYRHLMEQVQVLHSSHHAQSRLDNPLESSLNLADGYITLGQLLSPGWRMPNLSDVFLSCCETGLGVTEVTDDVLTLATGFLCAGARSVVSTLWAVDDIATSIFSIIYYRNRKQGFNHPESLQNAQLELRIITGEDLANNYRPQLEPILSEKLKHSETNRKQIKKERSQVNDDSNERKSLDVEYDKWNQLSRKISKTRRRLDFFCQEKYPFENPFYWAAFVCHGLS